MATISEALALAIQHHQGGRLQAAEQIYRRILAVEPNQPDVHYNLGNNLKSQAKLHEAIACYRRALERKPDFTEAHICLGNALKEQGKLDEAVACYRRAVELEPNSAMAHNNLGVALKEQGRLDEAVACCRRVVELRPDAADAHSKLGSLLRVQGKMAEAVACCRRALELKPDYVEAHYNLGSAFEEMGDLKSAEDSFRAALRHDPRFAYAHAKLAVLLGGNLPENDLAALRGLLEQRTFSREQGELPDAQRLLLHFGLAHVLDGRGNYAEAAEHLARGNSLQLAERRKRGQEYDPNEHALLVTGLIETCTREFFARCGDLGLGGSGSESEVPVFVVGLPRSGTTLVEQILAGHSKVFGAGEIKLVYETMAALGGRGADFIAGLRDLDRATARRLASRHLEQLRKLHPAALRIVNKMPENYLNLGLLASLFPRAKFIHCRRDLRDVAVSCWMTHFQEIHWASDQQQMASRFHDYQRLMNHWRAVLPVPLLEVDYEETVADLETVARRLVAWCGLAWEPNCLEFQRAKRPVKTASAVQVRQPIFRTSVGRWKHYEDSMGPLFARLNSMVAQDGTEQ